MRLLYCRPALADRASGSGQVAQAKPGSVCAAAGLRHRPAEESAVRSKPRAQPCGTGLDFGLQLSVRGIVPHDPVQRQVCETRGQHQCRPVHLSLPDGSGYPAVSGRLCAGGGRPDTASGVYPQRGAALQQSVWKYFQDSGSLSAAGGGQNHVPAGAHEENVQVGYQSKSIHFHSG